MRKHVITEGHAHQTMDVSILQVVYRERKMNYFERIQIKMNAKECQTSLNLKEEGGFLRNVPSASLQHIFKIRLQSGSREALSDVYLNRF